jgi:hypothetical protein
MIWPAPVVENRYRTRRLTPEDAAWAARARRYRREVANWCEVCEARPRQVVWGFVAIGRRLEVHHLYGRGIVSPVGYEADAELMTVCVAPLRSDRERRKGRHSDGRKFCHSRIHIRYGKDPQTRDGAERLARGSRRVHRAGFWRRGWHRLLPLTPIANRPR